VAKPLGEDRTNNNYYYSYESLTQRNFTFNFLKEGMAIYLVEKDIDIYLFEE
jgi:hypothetical protein